MKLLEDQPAVWCAVRASLNPEQRERALALVMVIAAENNNLPPDLINYVVIPQSTCPEPDAVQHPAAYTYLAIARNWGIETQPWTMLYGWARDHANQAPAAQSTDPQPSGSAGQSSSNS